MDASFEHDVAVRYRDLDTFGHVNNVVYGTYCEEARVAYIDEVLGISDIDEFNAVLASLELDFRRSVTELTDVTVGVRVPRLGDSSFPFEYEIAADGETVATGQSVQVVVDRESRESRPIPDQWRERIAEFEGIDA